MPIDTYPSPNFATSSAVLGYAQVTATQGSITAEVDVTGLSLTFSVPAGRRLKVTIKLLATSTVAGDILELISREGAGYLGNAQVACGTANAMETVVVTAIVSPSAGTHTYKAAFRRNAGSGTLSIYADTNVPSFILVEDITGGTGGSGPIQLGYAQITADQTGITTEVNAVGLVVTVNVPAGRRIRISSHLGMQSTVTTDTVRALIYDGAGLICLGDETAGAQTTVTASAVITPSAGTHVYQVNVARSNGTGTVKILAGATYPAYVLVEDITGTPAAGVGGLYSPPACRVYRTTTQTITNITDTAIGFDAERYDTNAMHDTVTNNSRITIQTPGLYLINAHIAFAANATGARVAAVRVNGTLVIANLICTNAGASDSTVFSTTTVYKLAAGDYIECWVFQRSGGNLDCPQYGNQAQEFAATWIGSGN